MSVELVCYVKTMTVLHENNVETIYRGSNLPEYYPFNETHLDGANLTRGFNPVHQQEELVGAMPLRLIRTNGSSLC